MVRRRYPHQVEGIQWLWRMHHGPYGGALLADDMGLGKTVQISVFLQCLYNRNLLQSCLIICPNSVMAVWEKTLGEWTGGEGECVISRSPMCSLPRNVRGRTEWFEEPDSEQLCGCDHHVWNDEAPSDLLLDDVVRDRGTA